MESWPLQSHAFLEYPIFRDEASVRTRVDRFQSFSVDAFKAVWTFSIKKRVKRQEIIGRLEREKGQMRLLSRLAIAKAEPADPAAKCAFLHLIDETTSLTTLVSTSENFYVERLQDP